MEIKLRHIGGYGGGASKIIEMMVQTGSTTVTENVTNLKGKVSEGLIQNLRSVADELEHQNQLIG